MTSLGSSRPTMHPALPVALFVALATLLVATVPADAVSGAGTTSTKAAECAVNVRVKPTTHATRKTVIPKGTSVVIGAEVAGGAYATKCGSWVSGSRWYAITAIAGRSVRSLYGVPELYAASHLFGTAPILQGIDVSQWQGAIDFAKVRASGMTFVIAKATEGRLYTDPAYARNRAGALAAGLAFTAYHWAHPDASPRDAPLEADHFLAVAGLRRGMLAPVVDIESNAGLGTAALTAWLETWVTRVYTRIGVRPVIYTTPSFWHSAMGDTRWFADNGYRLWIAHWDVATPSLPAQGWGGGGWSFWQSSDCGSVRGISGCVDLDRFSGSALSAAVRF